MMMERTFKTQAILWELAVGMTGIMFSSDAEDYYENKESLGEPVSTTNAYHNTDVDTENNLNISGTQVGEPLSVSKDSAEQQPRGY